MWCGFLGGVTISDGGRWVAAGRGRLVAAARPPGHVGGSTTPSGQGRQSEEMGINIDVWCGASTFD